MVVDIVSELLGVGDKLQLSFYTLLDAVFDVSFDVGLDLLQGDALAVLELADVEQRDQLLTSLMILRGSSVAMFLAMPRTVLSSPMISLIIHTSTRNIPKIS